MKLLDYVSSVRINEQVVKVENIATLNVIDDFLKSPNHRYPKSRFPTIYKRMREKVDYTFGDFIVYKHILNELLNVHNIKIPRYQLAQAWKLTEEGKKERFPEEEFERYIDKNYVKKEMSEEKRKLLGDRLAKSRISGRKVSSK